jgi:hypothetical protein
MVEYSRMPVPSLSSGCEIAPFLVRYMDRGPKVRLFVRHNAPQTKILEGLTTDEMQIFKAFFNG